MVERLLAQVPLFSSVPNREIKRLAKTLAHLDFPRDTVLFHEGDPAGSFYIIVEGEVEILKALGSPDERLLNVLGPGGYLGEMSLLSPNALRTASVRTRTAVRVLEMTRDALERLLDRWPAGAWEMARRVTRRLLDSEDTMIRDLRQNKQQAAKGFLEFEEALPQVLEKIKIEEDPEERLRLLADFARLAKVFLGRKGDLETGKTVRTAVRAMDRLGRSRLYIKTLGGFQVFLGAAPLDKRKWGGNQPQLLLKAVLCRNPRGVPKDVLIEDLWPEIDSVSGDRNFRVILHRLRKALEPSMDKSGSSYVHLNGNVVSLDEHLCRVDVQEFLSLHRQGKKARDLRDEKGALHAYEKAVALYAGDFLPEDLYVPWARGMRDDLRTRLLEILYGMGEIREQRGAFRSAVETYRRIIQMEPSSERAYQRLMILHSNRGMRNAALKVYEDCKKALRDELNADPDPLTDSIRRKVLVTP